MTPETSEISATNKKISPAPRVLVVDDEALIRWALSDRLARAGCLVCEAADGLSALDYFREGASRIDLVVLDVKLPDANGLDILKQIRHLCPTSRVVLMTAFGTPDTRQEARDNGAYDLLPKPFDLDDMLQTVQHGATSKPRHSASSRPRRASSFVTDTSRARIANGHPQL